jgi:transcriptional regulator with XRE-family HTH domain
LLITAHSVVWRPTVPQQDSPETAARKERFVANLRRLMDAHGLSISETARRAGIEDRKRFYRWATNGIARAAKDHQSDLDCLRRLFGLSNWAVLWGETAEVSLEDQLIAVVVGKPDYGYAAKLLFLLRTLGDDESNDLRRHIDRVFDEATRDGIPEQMMRVLNGKQVLKEVWRRSPSAYQTLIEKYGATAHRSVENTFPTTPPERMVDWLVETFTAPSEPIAEDKSVEREDSQGAVETSNDGEWTDADDLPADDDDDDDDV